jgi:UDP-N-acetylmuramyl tripeptide synthase
MTRVALAGHRGRVGAALVPVLQAEPDLDYVGGVGRGDDLGAFLRQKRPQMLIDFTHPRAALHNALAAVAAGLRLGVAPERIAAALGEMRAAFGRVETIEVGGVPVSILLIKNPAGANEVLRTLRLESREGEGGIDLWIALNDRIADGRDVSWIWDADFELLAGGVRRVVCSGTRAPEMALRLKYAGWPEEAIEVVPGIGASLDAAVAAAEGPLFALPTYTALLELRKLLADRGLAREFWR